MTRGGKKSGQEDEPDVGAGASADPGTIGASSPEDRLEELARLVKSLIRSQTARDQNLEKELSCQEQRCKGMQHQFQQIQLQVTAMQEDTPERGSSCLCHLYCDPAAQWPSCDNVKVFYTSWSMNIWSF